MSIKEEKKQSTIAVRKIVCIALVVGLALFCGIKLIDNVSDINRLKAQNDAAVQMLKQQNEENESIKAVLDSDNKDEYIEQKARENGYAKDGEVVFYDISSSK